MKKFAALVLALLLALSCVSALADMAGKQVALMTPYLGSVTTNQMVEYMKADLESRGAVVTVINTNNDFAELASQVENVAQSGQTDAIVLVSADPSQIANQLQDAFDAGVPVFGCDSGFIEGMQVNATSDNYQMGTLIVKFLFEDLMGGKGTVIGTTLGLILITVARSSLTLVGVDSSWQQMIVGVVIVAGTALSAYNELKNSR